MQAIIDIFRMNEVSAKARARIIISLWRAINHENWMNITEELVFELVSVLDPENPILIQLKNDLDRRIK
jgi:hypothetical protein